MRKYNKKLIGLILLGIMTLTLSVNTAAEEEVEKTACKTAVAESISAKYNLTLTEVGPGQYKIEMKGSGIGRDDNAEFKITGPAEYPNEDSQPTINAINTLETITKDRAVSFNGTPAELSDGTKGMAVNIMLVPDTGNLNAKKDIDCIYTGRLAVNSHGDTKRNNIYSAGMTTTNENSKYKVGSICYNFYNGIWNGTQFSGIKKADFDRYNYIAASGLIVGGKTAQSIYDAMVPYCNLATVSLGAEYSEDTVENMISNAITYVKGRTKSIGGTSKTFADLFNEIATHPNKIDKSGKEAKDNSLTCDWKKTASTGDLNDYYKNKKYYYKSEVVEPINVEYTFNYAPGAEKKTETKEVCTRKCTEAVKVEYGPPVASKAGLCFEYKVKVTSYAECTADITLDPPTETTSYCSPVAYCHDAQWRWDGNQAGPTEDFDLCIQSCDGGKYTSNCSKKCYKQVYTNSKLQLALTYDANVQRLNASPTDLMDEVDTCIENSSDGGCYYWSGEEILWKSKYQEDVAYSTDKRSLGRWYRDVNWKVSDIPGTFHVSKNGIKTKHYGGGSYCQDVCYWISEYENKNTGCKTDEYLNPHMAQADFKNNLKKYQAATAACEAAATCSSSKAEFTISINYDSYDDKNVRKVTTVDFPYTKIGEKNKDYISSLGEETESVNTTTNGNTTILSYDGCYSDRTEKNWYLTEWGFPGTYIHNKTGEISFEAKELEDGWYYDAKKFCMPLDAESVNTKWWEWYKINDMEFGCHTETQIENELKGTTGTSNGYNINASVAKFGYFGWEFDIKCFYALRNEVCHTDETNKCCTRGDCTGNSCETETEGVKNYMFRTIDTGNMFPNAPVEGETDPTKRPIGFNWTSKATNNKNPAYQVDPTALIESIKEKSTTLYNDESNLDYQFYLTPETLREIRRYNKEYSYNTWNGKVGIENGIYVYKSNLWGASDSGVEMTLDLRPYNSVIKTGTPGKNNE